MNTRTWSKIANSDIRTPPECCQQEICRTFHLKSGAVGPDKVGPDKVRPDKVGPDHMY